MGPIRNSTPKSSGRVGAGVISNGIHNYERTKARRRAYRKKMQGEFDEPLRRFLSEKKRMPSFAELMEIWNYRTKSAVHYRIQELADRGVIRKDGTGRIVPLRLEKGTRLLGVVEAGFPSAAEEELLDVMNFDEFLTPNKESSYILKVKGDSMKDAGIQPGDMVIVERKNNYKPGQIVIAMIDGEYTMKYLRKRGEQHYLEPANSRYKPIFPKESFKIEAAVTAVVRKY
ncbi:repressor LexA [Candidatus Kaiserbacteria bacterium]|nr:repressor LexA [Candidatus Kaiserbacteria bacterium]